MATWDPRLQGHRADDHVLSSSDSPRLQLQAGRWRAGVHRFAAGQADVQGGQVHVQPATCIMSRPRTGCTTARHAPRLTSWPKTLASACRCGTGSIPPTPMLRKTRAGSQSAARSAEVGRPPLHVTNPWLRALATLCALGMLPCWADMSKLLSRCRALRWNLYARRCRARCRLQWGADLRRADDKGDDHVSELPQPGLRILQNPGRVQGEFVGWSVERFSNSVTDSMATGDPFVGS